MVVSQVLSGVNDAVHIRLHQFRNDVDILEPSGCRGLGNVKDLDNILVVKELEKADLSDNTFRIDQVLKSLGDLLDSHFDAANMVVSGADDTVGAMSDLLNVLKLVFDAESSALQQDKRQLKI